MFKTLKTLLIILLVIAILFTISKVIIEVIIIASISVMVLTCNSIITYENQREKKEANKLLLN